MKPDLSKLKTTTKIIVSKTADVALLIWKETKPDEITVNKNGEVTFRYTKD